MNVCFLRMTKEKSHFEEWSTQRMKQVMSDIQIFPTYDELPCD